MRAVRAAGGGVRLVEVGEPAGSGELVEVKSVSICASDLRYLARGSERILGHEIAGVTSDGAPVIVEGLVSCGDCEWCARGSPNLCRLAGASILGLTVDGGMAGYFRAPRRALVPVPAGLSLDDASIAEASGTESGLARAIDLARPQGTVSTVSVFPADVRWPYRAAFLKEVCVVPSMGYGTDGTEGGARELERVAAMLTARPEIAAALITHRFGIEEAPRAFAVAAARPPGTFRVVMHP